MKFFQLMQMDEKNYRKIIFAGYKIGNYTEKCIYSDGADETQQHILKSIQFQWEDDQW